MLANGTGGVYRDGGGVYSDIAFDRLALMPLAAVGAYRRGDGPDLGGPLEFRPSLAAAYEFDDNEVLVAYSLP